MVKSKGFKTKIHPHAHSLILSHGFHHCSGWCVHVCRAGPTSIAMHATSATSLIPLGTCLGGKPPWPLQRSGDHRCVGDAADIGMPAVTVLSPELCVKSLSPSRPVQDHKRQRGRVVWYWSFDTNTAILKRRHWGINPHPQTSSQNVIQK